MATIRYEVKRRNDEKPNEWEILNKPTYEREAIERINNYISNHILTEDINYICRLDKSGKRRDACWHKYIRAWRIKVYDPSYGYYSFTYVVEKVED